MLLALFVFIESRVAQPLLPLRIGVNKVHGGTFLIQAVAESLMIGATLYLTFHLQIVLGMPPLDSGLASLPLTAAIMVAAPAVMRLLPVIGPRPLLIAGPLIVAVGRVYLSRITADGNYFVQVLPALIVMGVGMGAIFVPVQNLALTGVASHDAGPALATVHVAMQIGGSVGLSIFTAVYAASIGAPDALGDASRLTAFATGYSATFIAAAVAMVIASVVAIFLVRGPKPSLLPEGDMPVLAHAGLCRTS